MTDATLPASIPALAHASAERFGDAEALVDGQTALRGGDELTLSFRQLAGEVDRVAASVIASGIEPGERVGIWAPNVGEWALAALGASTAGAVLVPINTRYKGREAGDILARSGARLLLTMTGFLDTDYVDLLAAGGVDLPDLERTVLLRGAHDDADTWKDFLAAGADVDAAEVAARRDRIGPDDLSDIMFTSGTTGRPKGVMSSHGQTLRCFAEWSALLGLEAGDRYLVVNPFFHTFGYKAGIVAALLRGATLLPHAVFDADQVLARIASDRITVLPGPPALYQSLLAHPQLGEQDISSLRRAVTGAASIPVSLVERMRDELGFDTVLTAYGLTEATGMVTMCRDGDDAQTVATTSGRAIGDVEVRTVDDDGAATAPGEPGEVVVRGFNVMRGYLDDPEATAEAIDGDGWLRTGDIGVLDERGYLDITDRKKDVFIVGGFNAYPAEIESDLAEHPAIAQSVVVGMPDDRLGDVGCAFVVLRPDATLEPDELIAWCRERMANFKVPRRVVMADALPANASGKILKHQLRDRAAAR